MRYCKGCGKRFIPDEDHKFFCVVCTGDDSDADNRFREGEY